MTKARPNQICSWAGEIFGYFTFFEKTYFCKLVLGFSPDRNQTSTERFAGEWISIIIKKSWTFNSLSQRGGKTFERGRATFSKMPITPERNDISLPDIMTYQITYVRAQSEVTGEKSWSLATWWRYKREKNIKMAITVQPVVLSTWKSVLVQSATSVYKDICVSQKSWPPLADKVWAPVWQGQRWLIGMKLGGPVRRSERNLKEIGDITFFKGVTIVRCVVFAHTYDIRILR